MRIGIVGARVHGRPDLVRAFVRSLPSGTTVVSGAGEDVDTWAEEEARSVGLDVTVHRPLDRTRDAMLARNALIAGDVDELHTWPWVGSRGTYHTASLARARGVPVTEHKPEIRCEVYTARWGLRGEPDIFNVMRGYCQKHVASGRWLRIPDRHRLRVSVQWAREQMAPRNGRPGLSLLEVQKLGAREGVPSLGEPWAPSEKLLRPALEERHRIEAMEEQAYALTPARLGRDPTAEETERRLALFAEAEHLEQDHWTRYTEGFHAEMVQSYREKAVAWGWILTLPRVVLACACTRPDRCHRGLVSTYLGKLGATVGGEIER